MDESHYYDDISYNSILKGISTVKRVSDNADVSYHHSSIIYTYDPDWTPLAPSGSEYHNNDIDSTYRRLKNQIVGISGELITTGYGKDVDVSLNIYLNGIDTYNTSDVDISGVPFIGNYSTIIHGGDSMNVLDLFTYKISYYVMTNISDPDISYNVELYGDKYNTIYPAEFKQFSYDADNNEYYMSEPESTPRTVYRRSIGEYQYDRQKTYTYPSKNVNNTYTERYDKNGVYNINNFITLPSL